MEKLLSKIYDMVVFNEKDSIRYGAEFDTYVNELLESMKNNMSESELEEIKEVVYAAVFSAERYGFKLGARFLVRLLMEVFETPE